MTTAAEGQADPMGIRRADFAVLRAMSTRWSDEDVYGHVNNAVHYQLFDTAVNGWLIDAVGDVRDLSAFGVVAETGCRFLGELRFPETVQVGIALERLGSSAVVYRLALFGEHSAVPVAVGRFVHVYVDRDSRRPSAVPEAVRTALAILLPWPD